MTQVLVIIGTDNLSLGVITLWHSVLSIISNKVS